MFMLESYITPILLSYVDKYIKNFRLEDSQVSLWGGDATFHNLDLRLEVLEQELHLPFSFVSGHIRQLSIHVPWTKIASEPITITINTIECILKLRGADSVNVPRKEKLKKLSKPETEAPPGYVQQLINKIVSNIRIYCNNLILKYVEEDIVLSMNVKLLKFESANEKWEPAYTDLSPAQVMLRKIITVNDLTLCLDKRNAAGKIDVYQEPMLYRCSMTMHLLRHYHSATANRASTTRLDVYCNNMKFGMTEQQVPMLMRIIMLLYALQQKQLRPPPIESNNSSNTQQETRESVDESETWTGWAWSYVSSVLPAPWDEEFDNEFNNQSGHTLHMGFYVDNMSITFKVSEVANEHGYYNQKNLRYRPMLTLELQGIYNETIVHGLKWLNSSFGIGQALLFPVGPCSCSHEEIEDDQIGYCYLALGSVTNLHKIDSLFDENAIENKGKRRQYNISWDHHMTINSESALLERTSAVAFDYVYQMETPDDMTSEALYDLGSNYEFSNLSEMSGLRLCFGPFKLRLCSGFFHRISTLQVAASYYDYAPYSVPKPDLALNELLPPSEDDFDALCEFIPQRALRITFFAPVIELQLMEHPYFEATKGNLFRKRKKLSTPGPQLPQKAALPKLTLECQFFDISIQYPMYVNRLVHTTCQLPDPPLKLFNACYTEQNVKLIGLTSRLICNNTSTIMLTPCNMSYTCKSILKPQYWINPDIPHVEITFESESITINGTKAKMMIVAQIIEKLIKVNTNTTFNSIYNSTLLNDATKTKNLPYVELCIEGVRFKKVTTNATVSIDLSLGSIKAFIFEPVDVNKTNVDEIQQILFISGPEPMKTNENDTPLFTATMQYPLNPDIQKHPPIFVFNLQEIRICIDPLLCMWLLYTPTKLHNKSDAYVDSLYRNKNISEASGSVMETPRRLSSQIESVHSSSDREHLQIPSKQSKTDSGNVDLQEKIYIILKTWFDVWKGMLLSGDISQCTIYFPMQSLSAIGSQGIQQAVEQSIKKASPCDIMVITLPFANVRSAQRHNLSQYLQILPIKLTEDIWSQDKSSFPWTVSISDLSCFTIQFGHKFIFLKPVSLSATVGLATRPLNSDSIDSPVTSKTDLGHLGVCVHIDMSPVVISTSEVQVCLFASILYGLMEVVNNLLPDKHKPIVKLPDIQTSQSLTKQSSTLSPTVVLESTLETTSDQTPSIGDVKNLDTEGVKLTAWVQWTITRFTIELLSTESKNSLESANVAFNPRLKLVIDAEDIVSSLDFQSVYLKIKNKIGTVSIQHYKRGSSGGKWKPGPFCGIVMRLREDIATRHEDNGFLNITITRASCKHTHTLWGTVQKRQKLRKFDTNEIMQSQYISEIVVNVQPIDFIISMKTLNNFYMVLVPLLKIPHTKERIYDEQVMWNNQNLPLAYLDCQDIRIIVPASELCAKNTMHDVCIFQLEKICLSPTAVNPICRTPVRPDIYEQAAQARILNIPGSEVEDRQYQFDLIGLSISTSTWKDISLIFSNTSDNNSSSLRGMSENPALEWNNLEKGQPNMVPTLNLWQISEKFDIQIVAAPAMIYKDNTLICGNSIEINFVTDIKINLSLSQIKLFSVLLAEFSLLIEPFVIKEHLLCRSKIKFPYSEYLPVKHFDENISMYSNEIVRDSGIDTSDIKSVLSLKTQVPPLNRTISDSEKQYTFPRPSNTLTLTSISTPLDILLTGGGIFVSLYQLDTAKVVYSKLRDKNKKRKQSKKVKNDQGYEASEESVDEKSDNYNNYIPLIYFSIIQPNAYLSKHHLGKRFQVSCFDVKLKLYGPEYSPINHVPTEDDFPIKFIETRSGVPHPSTGILPAFFTIRYTKGMSKNATLDVDISKPTKILCSPNRWLYLLIVKDKVLDALRDSQKALSLFNGNKNDSELISTRAKFPDITYRKFQEIKDYLNGINVVSLTMDQIIFTITNENGYELDLGIKKFKNTLTLYTRPEKLCNSSTFHCITLTVVNENNRRLFLNPWTVSFEACLFWESWQCFNSEPQIHLTAESDCILLDINPESIQCFEIVSREFKEILSSFPLNKENVTEEVILTDKDQHYKDDLRAGAFQFVDANTTNADELPLPYQVIFWTKTITAMAWRYPQPRALTKVRIFPVPYKMTLNENQDDVKVLCHLEYWSDCRNCYLPFTQFYLSESEVRHLNLPNSDPQPIVASIWRVSITIQSDSDKELAAAISPRALAACMRIDSYFNKSLIPNLTAALYITKIDCSLYSHSSKIDSKLPKCLEKFNSDLAYPENQCFLTLTWDNLSVHTNIWSKTMFSTEICASMKCSVLDYTFLTIHPLVEPFTFKFDLISSNHLTCNLISKPIKLLFSTNVAHTLTVSSQLCMQNFNKTETGTNFIITTKFVICNNTNVSVRFGQASTDEEIILLPKHFHLYAWRTQKRKQFLKIAIENEWSTNLSIHSDGLQTIHFQENVTMFVCVKSLSATQKQVTLTGQLTICNMLLEHFEFKIVEIVEDNKEMAFKQATTYVTSHNTSTPSIFINNKKSYHLRLRFYGLESAWTGDIPLKEHANGSQPWLVKVPLQERGQFLSIWCRIVVQNVNKVKRVMAMLWPLFTIRSNLPINAKVDIHTPLLNVHLDCNINGKGRIQQLYCPGTIDHSHQLSFETENVKTPSNPYVPLSYNVVDQQKFFKRLENESIDEILTVLESYNDIKWPYFGDELDDIEWIVEEQPLTHVMIRYQKANQYSSSLLVELSPWCLLVNTLGTTVVILNNGSELCRLQHHGIVAPPKLEVNFNLAIFNGEKLCSSGPLQLAKSDWSQTFYMPKITGTIPLDGNIKTFIGCDNHICMVSITSSVVNEMRLLKVSSTHVLSNHMAMQMQVVCLAVPDIDINYNLPKNLDSYSFTLPPHLHKTNSGIPIIKWLNLDKKCDCNDYALYLLFSVQPYLGWSCPIRVDKPLVRCSFSVTTNDSSIPVVLTSQEHKGQIYLSIHNDPKPQIYIENKSQIDLFCGQSLGDENNIVEETKHFRWYCKINGDSTKYYSLPLLAEKFPELPNQNQTEMIVFASDSGDDRSDLHWSTSVNLTSDHDQFVRIPFVGDVKLKITNAACITIIKIESVSQVEISARDIRVRLSMHELHSNPSTTTTISSYQSSESFDMNEGKSTTIESSMKLRRKSDICENKSLLINTIPLISNWKSAKINIFIKSFMITFTNDFEKDSSEQYELANFVIDNIALSAIQTDCLTVKFSASAVQFDNQLYSRESYDFPVVLIGQEVKLNKKLNSLNTPIYNLINDVYENALITFEFNFDTFNAQDRTITGVKYVKITSNPVSCFIEDVYINRLMDYLNNFIPTKLVIWPYRKFLLTNSVYTNSVIVPEIVAWQCAILSKPLTCRNVIVNPISLLLSVHCSIKLYIALDQSPLQFGRFERKRLQTTPYRLGHAMTMHYLSGAIFGAGWVVSSLELLGSPGGLARAMGSGLRDFVSLPYRGLVQGPMAFLKGITHGSASLMRHVTAGTLQSVTKLASSVARNLDRLTLDEEHVKRTEEQRRQKPQGLTQGFIQGLTGLGISLLGAVGGIAHHPLQSMISEGASPRSFATGVGLGLVGVVTKPLSGAAELVALTGQGLLQGAGWNSLPEPRCIPLLHNKCSCNNSTLKYNWKLIHWLSQNTLLYVTEATYLKNNTEYEAVALVLTTEALIVINLDDDRTKRIDDLSVLDVMDNNDPTILSFKITEPVVQVKTEDELIIEMDPDCRARVADYVRNTVGLLNLTDNKSTDHSDISISPLSSPGTTICPKEEEATVLSYFVNPQNRNYFICLLSLIKQQKENYNFSVL